MHVASLDYYTLQRSNYMYYGADSDAMEALLVLVFNKIRVSRDTAYMSSTTETVFRLLLNILKMITTL